MNISHDTSLRVTLIGILVLLISSANGEPPMPVAEVNYDSEFKFTRMIYSSSKQGLYGYGYRGSGGWRADWPEAEYHFLEGLSRLTRVNASAEGHYLKLLDADLFDFPWLYVLEAGSWVLSNEEITQLREYLLRGGFLMVDDFHGTLEWAGFHVFYATAISGSICDRNF